MKPSNETTTSILAKQLESFSTALSVICQRFLDELPEIVELNSESSGEVFLKYLQRFSFNDDSLMKFLTSCAIFGASNPMQSYITFSQAYPLLESEANSTGKKAFLSYFPNISPNNIVAITAIRFFLSRCLASFTIELFNQSDTYEEFNYVLQKVISLYLDLQSIPLNNAYFLALMEAYSKLVYFISKKRPDITLNCLQGELSKLNEMNDIQSHCFIILFSKITLAEDIDINNILDILNKSYELYKESNKETSYHIDCTEYMLNITIQTINKVKEQEIIRNIYNTTVDFCTEVKVKDNSYKFLSLLTNYDINGHERLKFEDFYKEFIEPNINNKILASSIIESIEMKLYFQRYYCTYEMKLKHPYFSWKSEEFEEIYPIILNLLKTKGNQFDQSHSEITGLFELLASYDFQIFLHKFVPQLIDDFNLFNFYKISFCNAFHTIFANLQEFLIINSNITDEDIIELNERAIKISLNELQPDKNVSLTCKIPFTTNSFTKSLISAVETKEVALRNMILIIGDTTFPIFNKHKKPKNITESISKWVTDNEQIIIESYKMEELEQPKINTLLSLKFDETRYAFLRLIVLIEPNDELLKCICYSPLNVPRVGSLGIRVLQALIHRFPEYSEKIISYICLFFIENQLSPTSIEILIFTLKMVVKASKYEGIIFNKNTLNSLTYVLIIGLCMNLPYIREMVLKMCKKLETENFFLSTFLKNYEEIISRDAIRRSIRAVSIVSDEKLKVFPILTFKEIIKSNVPSLYIYYISSFGKYLIHEFQDNDLIEVINKSFKILINILIEKDKIFNFNFMFNSFAMLLSISGIINYNSNIPKYYIYNRLQIITKNILKYQQNSIQLIGMFSAMPPELLKYLLPFLCNKNENIQLSLVFTLRELLTYNKIKIEPYIYTILHSSLISNINNKLFLDNFCHVINQVLIQIYNSVKNKEQFMVENICSKIKIESLFLTEKWFNYLYHLNTPESLKPLSSWLRISPIPTQYFEEFIETLPRKVEQIDPTLGIVIFSRYYLILKDFFFKESRKNYSMFYSISSQIKNINYNENYDELDLRNNSLILMIYQNCGTLIAKCMYYLVNKNSQRRNEALRFLTSIVYIVMLIRNNSKGAATILKKIEEIKKSISLISLSVFIQKGFSQLNELLSTYFQFCSEQFIYECLNNKHKRKIHSKKSSSNNNINSLYSNSSNNNNNNNNSSISNKKILRKKSSVSDDSLLYSKYDNAQRSSISIELISKWLKPMKIHTKEYGICLNCEKSYQCFNLYSFVERLLILCNSQGMTKSIAAILDVIINTSPHNLLLCLYGLESKNNEYLESSLLFGLYLYTKKPKILIHELAQRFSIKHWYFYEIQISKIEQFFNINKFINELNEEIKLNIDDEDEEDEEFQIDYQHNIIFSLKLIIKCRQLGNQTSLSYMKPLESQILIYCLIDNNNFNEETNNLISQITGILPPTHQQNEWNYHEILPFIEGQEKLLLEWGLCCGNLSIATNALKIFYLKNYLLNNESIQMLLRALHIVSISLNDRTNPNKKQQTDDMWLLRVVGDSNRPRYDTAVNYLTIGLKILLNNIPKNNNKFINEIFWTGFCSCKCQENEYQSIYESGLSIIHSIILTKHNFNFQPQDEFHGLINILLTANLSNYEYIEKIFEIFINLIINNKTELLRKFGEWKTISAFVLVPYRWSLSIDTNINQQLSKSLIEYEHNETERRIIEDAMNGQRKNNESLIKFSETFSKKLKEEDLLMILTFYSKIIEYCPSNIKESIYYICSEIIKDKTRTEIQKEFTTLAYYAINERSNENSEAALMFLKNVSTDVSLPQKLPQKTTNKQFSPFPLMSIYNEPIHNWKPQNNIDIFQTYLTFPPLYITDFTFHGCQVLNLWNSIRKIKISPFTEWYNELFEAQLHSGTPNKEGGADAVIDYDLKQKEFNEEIKKRTMEIISRNI